MQYAIIYLETPSNDKQVNEILQLVQKIDAKAYMDYAPSFYIVSYSGTSVELAKELGFVKTPDFPIPLSGMVIRCQYYYGYANMSLWEWLETRDDGPT
ncbi:MAG: hypothetical protein OXB94_07930 [Nitrospira sp.]|nr:hypothetical protein [Nitrospira sp.]